MTLIFFGIEKVLEEKFAGENNLKKPKFSREVCTCWLDQLTNASYGYVY